MSNENEPHDEPKKTEKPEFNQDPTWFAVLFLGIPALLLILIALLVKR